MKHPVIFGLLVWTEAEFAADLAKSSEVILKIGESVAILSFKKSEHFFLNSAAGKVSKATRKDMICRLLCTKVVLYECCAFCCWKKLFYVELRFFFILITVETKRKLQMCQNERGMFDQKCCWYISSLDLKGFLMSLSTLRWDHPASKNLNFFSFSFFHSQCSLIL